MRLRFSKRSAPLLVGLRGPASFKPIRLLLWPPLLAIVAVAASDTKAIAQNSKSVELSPKPEQAMVQLNFPEEVELKLLVDYVSTRLGVKILYDDQLANKRITIKAPGQIPADSLLGLLESALKMKGMALVEGDVSGWKRIRATNDLSQIAQPRGDQPLELFGNTAAVTQVFELKHADPEKVTQIIKPFLTQPGANTITLTDQRLLIVTDYADNLVKISALVEVIDRPGPETSLEFYTAQHVEAAALAQQVTQAVAAQNNGKNTALAEISHDQRTNQLLVVGTAEQVQQVLQLARALDMPLDLKTEIYGFRYVDAARVNQLVQELFDPLTVKRLYRSAVDSTDNLLVVTATPEIHERVKWLRDQMDMENKQPNSAVKFYRLKHANATEVLATIQAIEQTQQQSRLDHLRGVSPLGRGGVSGGRNRGGGFSSKQPEQAVPGPNQPSEPGKPPGETPAVFASAAVASQSEPANEALIPGVARVTVDQPTNTIIVVADRTTQQMYEELVVYLDHRPLQVMIEAKVVIMDTSRNFSLGVDLSGPNCDKIGNVFTFTQFGVSAVDPVSGALSLVPGRGLNAALVSPEDGNAILKALSAHKKARVMSSPRVLVNDNATGTLASVQEVPFTSVNASNTVATTSFAGFAEAGTSIEVTPRISDDDHLQLDYVISLNNFTGSGGQGVPPPRQTDEVASTVTIPDGYTVIVGGLNRQNNSDEYDGIPLLDRIPVVKNILGATSKANSQTTLFVFLKPTILRDDKFRDLKFLSDRDLGGSCSVGNLLPSRPLFVD
jgi:general secretion pathway protein D